MGQSHLPGINEIDSNPWEHLPKDGVQLKVVPVTVEKAHLRPQLLGVCCPDNYHGLRASIQELDHCSPDVPEPPDIHLQGEGAEVRPHGYGNHGVLPSHDAIQLIRHVTELTAKDGGEADGRAVAAVPEQDAVLLVHRKEGTHILGTTQVKFH